MTTPFEAYARPPYLLDIELLDETGIRIRVPGIQDPVTRFTTLHPTASGSFLELRSLAREALHEAVLTALSAGAPSAGENPWDANTGPYRISIEPPYEGISHVHLLAPGSRAFGHPSLVPMTGAAEHDAAAVAEWALARLVPRKSSGLLRALAIAAGCEDPDEPFRASTLAGVGLPFWIRPVTELQPQ